MRWLCPSQGVLAPSSSPATQPVAVAMRAQGKAFIGVEHTWAHSSEWSIPEATKELIARAEAAAQPYVAAAQPYLASAQAGLAAAHAAFTPAYMASHAYLTDVLASAEVAIGPSIASASATAQAAAAPALAAGEAKLEELLAPHLARHGIGRLEPGYYLLVSITAAAALLALLTDTIVAWRGARSRREAPQRGGKGSRGGGGGSGGGQGRPSKQQQKQKQPQPPATKGAKKGKKGGRVPTVRTCRFCEVAVPNDAHVAAHLDGKKHRKLAGNRAPEECWVWVEVEEDDECEVIGDDAMQREQQAREAAAAAAAAQGDGGEADGWAEVGKKGRKKRDEQQEQQRQQRRSEAAARRAAEEEEDSEVEEPERAPVVHHRCSGCGAMNTYIETDPEDEECGYCRDCWRKWYRQAAAPEPEPEKEVVPWRTPWAR